VEEKFQQRQKLLKEQDEEQLSSDRHSFEASEISVVPLDGKRAKKE
jgi:hypothetical protein